MDGVEVGRDEAFVVTVCYEERWREDLAGDGDFGVGTRGEYGCEVQDLAELEGVEDGGVHVLADALSDEEVAEGEVDEDSLEELGDGEDFVDCALDVHGAWSPRCREGLAVATVWVCASVRWIVDVWLVEKETAQIY